MAEANRAQIACYLGTRTVRGPIEGSGVMLQLVYALHEQDIQCYSPVDPN